METVVGFVENEGKIIESRAAEDGSTLSPNQIADPVVYKLVRVFSFTCFDWTLKFLYIIDFLVWTNFISLATCADSASLLLMVQ